MSSIKQLEILFNKPTVLSYNEWFDNIATELMSNYLIETNVEKYRLTEIEFYYHCEDHPDTTTYGYFHQKPIDRIYRHKLAQTNTNTWFFHYSGVDIVFGSEGKPGGILIRAIKCIERH